MVPALIGAACYFNDVSLARLVRGDCADCVIVGQPGLGRKEAWRESDGLIAGTGKAGLIVLGAESTGFVPMMNYEQELSLCWKGCFREAHVEVTASPVTIASHRHVHAVSSFR